MFKETTDRDNDTVEIGETKKEEDLRTTDREQQQSENKDRHSKIKAAPDWIETESSELETTSENTIEGLNRDDSTVELDEKEEGENISQLEECPCKNVLSHAKITSDIARNETSKLRNKTIGTEEETIICDYCGLPLMTVPR